MIHPYAGLDTVLLEVGIAVILRHRVGDDALLLEGIIAAGKPAERRHFGSFLLAAKTVLHLPGHLVAEGRSPSGFVDAPVGGVEERTPAVGGVVVALRVGPQPPDVVVDEMLLAVDAGDHEFAQRMVVRPAGQDGEGAIQNLSSARVSADLEIRAWTRVERAG